MALLKPHWETIAPVMREVLNFIGTCPFAARFYLAGGTALALRLGHRRSVDLDFFSETDDVMQRTRQEIIHAFLPLMPQVIENTEGNLLLEVQRMHVGFFGYSYALVSSIDAVENIALAGVADIGLMKLDALISRGSRKDFYDLYFVAREIPIPELLKLGQQKYPYARDFEVLALEGLTFFENAERDVPIPLLVEVSWAEVKQFFINTARELGQTWFS